MRAWKRCSPVRAPKAMVANGAVKRYVVDEARDDTGHLRNVSAALAEAGEQAAQDSKTDRGLA